MPLTVRRLSDDEKAVRLIEVAQLRIKIFAEWPYLYEGDLAYEATYLKPYVDDMRAVIIGAFDDDNMVGAATSAPLISHASEFSAPFLNAGLNPDKYYYLAESVLLPQYRGQGIGVQFFEQREQAAQKFGFLKATFCAVERPYDHPLRPKDYQPLDMFWRNRGYQKSNGLKAEFSWKDAGNDHETKKPMVFWQKQLR